MPGSYVYQRVYGGRCDRRNRITGFRSVAPWLEATATRAGPPNRSAAATAAAASAGTCAAGQPPPVLASRKASIGNKGSAAARKRIGALIKRIRATAQRAAVRSSPPARQALAAHTTR